VTIAIAPAVADAERQRAMRKVTYAGRACGFR
jgi:hypothetical protein